MAGALQRPDTPGAGAGFPCTALCEQRPQVLEQRAKDGTLRCPAIRLAASEGQLAAGHDGREVKWRVGGVPARHIMLCLTVRLAACQTSLAVNAERIANHFTATMTQRLIMAIHLLSSYCSHKSL